jgi:biotin carboxyl carrier protein
MSDKSYTPASGEGYQVRRKAAGTWTVQKGAEAASEHGALLEPCRIDHRTVRLLAAAGDTRRLYWVYAQGNKRVLSWPGGSIEIDAADLAESTGASGGKLRPLKLTMPGKVVDVKVKEGDVVQEGQGLVVVEAMKMENLLLASARARVAKVHVAAGDRLESGATLITFESAD